MYTQILLSQNPIFIIGNGRSGTTLLQSLIGTQENVLTFRETHFFTPHIQSKIKLNPEGTISEHCLEKLYKTIKKLINLDFSDSQKNEITLFAKNNVLSIRKLFEIIVFSLLREQVNEVCPSIIWLEKTPGHCRNIKQILECYPKARIIHIVRNPVAVIYSSMTKFPFSKNLTVEGWANVWNDTMNAVESYQSLQNVYTIRYENLVEKAEDETRKICAFLKIEFDKNTLKNYRKIAKQVTLKEETWKYDAQSCKIKNTNLKAFKNMTWLNILLINYYTESKAIEYGYIQSKKNKVVAKFIIFLRKILLQIYNTHKYCLKRLRTSNSSSRNFKI